jgi:hypothetical protein
MEFKREKMMKTVRIFCVLLMSLVSNSLFAGSNAGGEAKFSPEEISRFAKQVEKYAAAQGAKAFIIGRVGRPPEQLPKGVEFTHTAVAIYSMINLPDGKIAKGYAIHNLYQTADKDKKDISELVTDYPLDFFWGAHQLRTGIIIPDADLQQRLVEAYATGVNHQVHVPRYSVLANPYNADFQNCTEHTLDVINAAIYQTTNYEQLKANTRAHFKAQPMKINGMKVLLGSMVMADVKTSDQSSKLVTTTMGSIGHYLAQNNLLAQAVIIEQDGQLSPMRYDNNVLVASK